MSKLRTALVAGAAVVAAFAGGVSATLVAVAQEHGHPTDAQMAEHHRQAVALLSAVLADTDFDAVERHVVTALRAHADEIGGDTAAMESHITAFLDQVSAHVAENPQAAAEHIAEVLIQAHMPRE